VLGAAEEDAIVGDSKCCSREFGLRVGSPALRVEPAILGDGVRERDDEADEWLRSCLRSLDMEKQLLAPLGVVEPDWDKMLRMASKAFM
jgi:hypothetical protein